MFSVSEPRAPICRTESLDSLVQDGSASSKVPEYDYLYESEREYNSEFYGTVPKLPVHRPKQWRLVQLRSDNNQSSSDEIKDGQPISEAFRHYLIKNRVLKQPERESIVKTWILPLFRRTRKKEITFREAAILLVKSSAVSGCAPALPSMVSGISVKGHSHTVWEDAHFIKDCLDWHNLMRARHGIKQLQLDPALCEMAYRWAVFLANINEFYHQNNPEYGENLLLYPKQILPSSGETRRKVSELDGKYVAIHWYRDHCTYPYNNKEDHILHSFTSEFTQMVWAATRQFGCSKARAISGKTIIVAYYYPKGNIPNKFHLNVVQPREYKPRTDRRTGTKVRLKL